MPDSCTRPAPAAQRRAMRALLAALGLIVLAGPDVARNAMAATSQAGPPPIRVGPTREIKRIADAARIARNGDVIEIDAGDYRGDVAVWTQDALTLRGVGGHVRLVADGQAAEGKGIWVLRGGDFLVEDLVFVGARVADRNGAGIRVDAGRLTVRGSSFLNNENGILAANREDITVAVENCEFGYNGAGDGQSHNLYVGAIGRLEVSGSYFHHAMVGHLLKSRARESIVRYNRLTDEKKGRASYEMDFPSGGIVTLVGNIVQQGADTENPHLIAFGAEGYRWPKNTLTLVHNTLVDDRPSGGIFLRVAADPDAVTLVNNLFVGPGQLNYPADARRFGDARIAREALVDPTAGDFRISPAQKVRLEPAATPFAIDDVARPVREYVHPRQTRALGKPPLRPGALQDAPARKGL